jgi:hypothetical protein
MPLEDKTASDPEILKQLVIEMAITISNVSQDMELKCIVQSVFDTISVEDTFYELKAYNEGVPRKWLFSVKDSKNK